MARPKKNIDWRKVDKLLEAQCHGTEIAAYFGIHEDTLYKRVQEEFNMGFSAYSQQKKSKGKAALKLAQWENAQGGNTPMQIWLGKNHLDQKDKVEKEIKGGRTINISITDELQEEKEESKEDQNQDQEEK